MISALSGPDADEIRAKQAAEEIAAEESAAEQKAEKLLWQTRLAEEQALQARREQEQEEERAEREAARQRAIEERAAEQRRLANPFQLQGRYKNRKGYFTVIALSADKLRIRWDTGEEITDTIESQERILHRIEKEERGSTGIYVSRQSTSNEPAHDLQCQQHAPCSVSQPPNEADCSHPIEQDPAKRREMLEYVDFDAFERREQELGRHRRTNEDAAVQRAISQIEGN